MELTCFIQQPVKIRAFGGEILQIFPKTKKRNSKNMGMCMEIQGIDSCLQSLNLFLMLEAFSQGVLKFYFKRNCTKNICSLETLEFCCKIYYKYFCAKQIKILICFSIKYLMYPLMVHYTYTGKEIIKKSKFESLLYIFQEYM